MKLHINKPQLNNSIYKKSSWVLIKLKYKVKLHINKQQLNMKNIVIHTIKYKITAKVKNDKGKKKVDLRKDLRNQWYLTQQIIYTKLK